MTMRPSTRAAMLREAGMDERAAEIEAECVLAEAERAEATAEAATSSCFAPWCGIDGKHYGNPGVCNAPGGHRYKPPAAAADQPPLPTKGVTTVTPEEQAAVAAEKARTRAQEIEATIESVTKWWLTTAEADAATTAPKSAEYGAADLAIMGKVMEALFPGIATYPAEQREAIGIEMAVAFYVMGKVSRLFGAYEQGRLPTEDTWFDITVYSMMARRTRSVGYWV